ncbi:glutathione S-transferase N-terminal domain-containing protein [Methylobacterium oryzisoli]|uniref:glutathione S-transferase N-terminal domain-containing protein n=1 Tax=Methylobacterium oryzisoli TaxID=3385502 RepID=UPI0038915363
MARREVRLVVFAPSHFCERARWALDHTGVIYREVRWAPGPHALLAKRLGTGTSLPILDTGTDVIQGSGRILDWTGIRGHDPDLEGRFTRWIGPLVRRYLYSALLHDPSSNLREVQFDGVSRPQALIGRLLWPLTRQRMIRAMEAQADAHPGLERQVEAALDWFDAQVVGRHYLVGGRFGRADITAASLLAPLARPAACPVYQQIRLPFAVEDALRGWQKRRSLLWVERMYTKHRYSDKQASF